MANRLTIVADRLDLLDRHRRSAPSRKREQAAQGPAARLVVDQPGVFLEDVVAARPGGVLQLEDGLRVEQVRLTLAAPLVLAADRQLAVRRAGPRPGG